MSNSLTRKVFFIALLVELLAITANVLDHSLVAIAATLLLLAVVAQLITWIGAIVKTAQLKYWGWFIALIFGGLIAMLVYVLVGPEIPGMNVALD